MIADDVFVACQLCGKPVDFREGNICKDCYDRIVKQADDSDEGWTRLST